MGDDESKNGGLSANCEQTINRFIENFDKRPTGDDNDDYALEFLVCHR